MNNIVPIISLILLSLLTGCASIPKESYDHIRNETVYQETIGAELKSGRKGLITTSTWNFSRTVNHNTNTHTNSISVQLMNESPSYYNIPKSSSCTFLLDNHNRINIKTKTGSTEKNVTAGLFSPALTERVIFTNVSDHVLESITSAKSIEFSFELTGKNLQGQFTQKGIPHLNSFYTVYLN